MKISSFKSILQIPKNDMGGHVQTVQTSRFKIKKKIENSQKPNLDHNALIFIFSLKNSLLKLFSRPRVQRPSLLSPGNLGNHSEPPGNVSEPPAELYIPMR